MVISDKLYVTRDGKELRIELDEDDVKSNSISGIVLLQIDHSSENGKTIIASGVEAGRFKENWVVYSEHQLLPKVKMMVETYLKKRFS